MHPTAGTPVFLLPNTISLYFTFIKMVIGYIAMRFLVVDVYNLVAVFSEQLCNAMALKHSKISKFCLTYLFELFPSPQEYKQGFQ
jgi:hypothetical protein